ncbi:hypothetical protein CEXT_653661 [Caerostris extrusa]|uniref:Uncharacterized protein n=1 Tax=Caerostris extrusa TaxID=172846 RepID=A0AAV4NBK8_CAEEX|nr:hypothetical protein CEXT_653661 [Caerostris extrusa]
MNHTRVNLLQRLKSFIPMNHKIESIAFQTEEFYSDESYKSESMTETEEFYSDESYKSESAETEEFYSDESYKNLWQSLNSFNSISLINKEPAS